MIRCHLRVRRGLSHMLCGTFSPLRRTWPQTIWSLSCTLPSARASRLFAPMYTKVMRLTHTACEVQSSAFICLVQSPAILVSCAIDWFRSVYRRLRSAKSQIVGRHGSPTILKRQSANPRIRLQTTLQVWWCGVVEPHPPFAGPQWWKLGRSTEGGHGRIHSCGDKLQGSPPSTLLPPTAGITPPTHTHIYPPMSPILIHCRCHHPPYRVPSPNSCGETTR